MYEDSLGWKLNAKEGEKVHRLGRTLPRLLIAGAVLSSLAPSLFRLSARAQTIATTCDDIVPEVTFTPPDPPPEVVGDSVDDALSTLEDWNQAIWKGTAPILGIPDPVPTGIDRDLAIVMGQVTVPDAGDVESAPTVYVCLGGKVPNLIGRTLREAGSDLAAAGLVAKIVQEDADDEWTVETQDPNPESVLPFGGEVSLGVLAPSTAPVGRVTVPEIVGLSFGDARRLVEASDLRLRPRKVDGGDATIVVEQDPPAGTRVDADSVVFATVRGGATGPGNSPPPDLDSAEPTATFLPTLILAGLIVLLVAIALRLALRNWRQRVWVTSRVTAEAHPDQKQEFSTTGRKDRPAHVARLDSRFDAGTQILQEAD